MRTVLYLGRTPRGARAGGYHYAAGVTLGSELARRWRFVAPAQTVPGEGSARRRFARDVSSVDAVVRTERPDVAHMLLSYRDRWPLEVAQFGALRARGVPVVLDIRAGAFQPWWATLPGAARVLYGAMIRAAAGLTAELEADLPFLARTFDRIARYSPSFVTNAALAGPVANLRVARGAPIRLIWAGRFSEAKGAGTVLDALLQVTRPRFRLTVTGDIDEPDLEARLRAFAADAPRGIETDLRGFLPTPDDVLDVMRSQHVLLLPSAWSGEGHSNAVNQAMAAGLAVIASSGGHLPAILPPEGARFVPAGDADALATALDALAARPASLAAMGRANRARVAERYTERVALGAFEAAWLAAVEGR
jgi:glycosyltransferase involved in cell wall biosynthesis